MADPEIVAHLSRAVELFHRAGARDSQEREFRAIVGLLQGSGVTIKVEGDDIMVNGAPVPGDAHEELIQRLTLHGVSELNIPQDPPVADLFELLKAVADPPGTAQDIPSRLRASGAYRVSVSIERLALPQESPRRSRRSLGIRGILRGDPMADIASPAVPVAGVPEVTHGSAALPPPDAPPSPTLQEEATSPVFAPGVARSQSAYEMLRELNRNPQAPNATDLLAVLVHQVEAAVRSGKIGQVLTIISEILRNEQQVPEGNLRRQYGIALKRMFTRSVLQGFARLVAVPAHEAEALEALQRAGADGVAVLVDLLIAAPTVAERRVVFNALTQVKQGTGHVVHMLGHPEWFVVRNMAELAGELGLEEAVPVLGKHLDHPDERVRKAIALALAKIGTPATVEPLRRALRDKSQGVRLQVALGIGGRKARALAMPLLVMLEQEPDPVVQRELIMALGRIGSPDAIRALSTLARPTRNILRRKRTVPRLAAVAALRLAGTPAVGTLQSLARDADKEVRRAARQALVELQIK